MISLFAVQYFIAVNSGGGEHRIAIVDATGADVGERIRQELEHPAAGASSGNRPTFAVSVEAVPPERREAAIQPLQEQVRQERLDGVLWLPPGLLAADTANYEGRDASSSTAMSQLESALQLAVQSERLRAEGIDQQALGRALMPVSLQAFKTGEGGVQGNPTAARILGFLMAFAIYMAVLMYGQGIQDGGAGGEAGPHRGTGGQLDPRP